MNKIALDFEGKDVVFYNLYTREPHAGQKMRAFDFSDKKQTQTHEERVEYALEMIEEQNQALPVIIDIFGPDCIQNTLGGRMPNSVVIIDKEGKIAYWKDWINPAELKEKLKELTATAKIK